MKPFRVVAPLLAAILVPIAAMALNIKEVTFSTKDAGKVSFSHNAHMKQSMVQNNCKTCHNKIYELKNRKRYTMADMEKGKSCGACHDGKRAFPLKECTRCHLVKDIAFKIKGIGVTTFSHKVHVAKYGTCNACHSKLYKTGPNKSVSMAEMEKGKSCGACHAGKEAFPLSKCEKCHPTKDVTFDVKDAGKVVFSHKVHVSLFKCPDCHTSVFKLGSAKKPVSMAEMEKGKSCGACHDGKSAFSVSGDCAACHKI